MISNIVRYGNSVRLYLDTVEEKVIFSKILANLDGVERVEGKNNTRTLKIVFRRGSPAEYLLNHLTPKGYRAINKEDIHFYLNPLIKHPAIKLGFSILTFGFSVGLLSFAFCSMFMIPTLKTTFGR